MPSCGEQSEVGNDVAALLGLFCLKECYQAFFLREGSTLDRQCRRLLQKQTY